MDAIDLRLVELLRQNARTSFAKLARQVGLSPPAVHERVGKLEQAGVIRSYRADVAPDAIGLDITALIGIMESPGSDLAELACAMAELPEIDSCYFLAGEESYLLKVRVPTMADLERLVIRLGSIPGVGRTRTTVALSTKWEDRPPPAPAPPVKAAVAVIARVGLSAGIEDAAPPNAAVRADSTVRPAGAPRSNGQQRDDDRDG